ncbi:metalloregulator ArsR/SmtB family transcription factor [Rhodobacteraceae bacterium DSL-40]|uniref:ArsR/SmtB family transcription factor n=1 Tax=Amaricoccus sp. B4 TaxID=3368557 RepID=UPI000DAD7D56
METTDAIAAFSALAQDTRLAVFRLLVQAGPDGMLAGEISAALDVRPNTLSANLAILLNAGLVQNTREGRMVRYIADLEGLRGLLRFIMQDCCGGRPELCQPVIDAVACDC